MSRNAIKAIKTSNSLSRNQFLKARLSQQVTSYGFEEDDQILKQIETPISKIKDKLMHGDINLKSNDNDINIIIDKMKQSNEKQEIKKRLKELKLSDKLMPQSESNLNISSIQESLYQLDINSSKSFIETGDLNIVAPLTHRPLRIQDYTTDKEFENDLVALKMTQKYNKQRRERELIKKAQFEKEQK